MLDQCAKVILCARLPPIVEVKARHQADFLFRRLEVCLWFTKDKLGNSTAFSTSRLAFILKVFPGFIERIFVQDFIRILKPAQKSRAALTMDTLRELPLGDFSINKPAVLSNRCTLDSSAQP